METVLRQLFLQIVWPDSVRSPNCYENDRVGLCDLIQYSRPFCVGLSEQFL